MNTMFIFIYYLYVLEAGFFDYTIKAEDKQNPFEFCLHFFLNQVHPFQPHCNVFLS